MTNFKYSLIIEATDEPNFFGFYSPDLEGFSGVGKSVEDCLAKAQLAMDEHVQLLEQQGLPIPAINPNPTVTVQNSERVVPAA
jgi:predicted RNase H-like HicB family nuclease